MRQEVEPRADVLAAIASFLDGVMPLYASARPTTSLARASAASEARLMPTSIRISHVRSNSRIKRQPRDQGESDELASSIRPLLLAKSGVQTSTNSPRNEPAAWVDAYSFSFAKRNPKAMNMAPTAR